MEFPLRKKPFPRGRTQLRGGVEKNSKFTFVGLKFWDTVKISTDFARSVRPLLNKENGII